MRNRSAFLFALVLLGGCSLPPRNTGTAYMMTLQPAAVPAEKSAPLHLAVDFPSSAPELQTARIALLRGGGTLDYYAGARWADFLPLIVQDNLIKSFEASGGFTRVTDSGSPGIDEELKIDIRHFEARYSRDKGAPVIRVELQATLMNRHTLTAIGHFGAAASAAAASDTLPAIHKAFRAAFTDAERQMAVGLAKAKL